MLGKIYYEGPHKVFRINIRGEMYYLNIDFISKEKEKDFIRDLSDVLCRIENKATLSERFCLQQQFRNLIGIKDLDK